MTVPNFFLRVWNMLYNNGTEAFPVPLTLSNYWELSGISGLDSSFMGLEALDTVSLTAPQEISSSYDSREITFTLQIKAGMEQEAWEFASRWFISNSPASLVCAENANVFMNGRIASFSHERFEQTRELTITFIPYDRFWHGADNAYTYELFYNYSSGGTELPADLSPFMTPVISDVETFPTINYVFYWGGGEHQIVHDLYPVIIQNILPEQNYDNSIMPPVQTTKALHLANLDDLNISCAGASGNKTLSIDCQNRKITITYKPTGSDTFTTVDITSRLDFSPITVRSVKSGSQDVFNESYDMWDMIIQPGSAAFFLRGNVTALFVDAWLDQGPPSGVGNVITHPLWATWPRDITDKDAFILDGDIIPENIREGVNILGVEGSLKSILPEYTGSYIVTPSKNEQTLLTADKSMKGDIVINPISPINTEDGIQVGSNLTNRDALPEGITTVSLDNLDMVPTPVVQVLSEGWYDTEYSQTDASRIAFDIAESERAKIIPENIRNGVSILGVEGDYIGEAADVYPGPYSVTPDTAPQTLLTADKMMSQNLEVEAIAPVNTPNGIELFRAGSDTMTTPADTTITGRDQKIQLLPLITSRGEGWYTPDYTNMVEKFRVGIDPAETAKIIPENIREGVNILGVEGSLETGGDTAFKLFCTKSKYLSNVLSEISSMSDWTDSELAILFASPDVTENIIDVRYLGSASHSANTSGLLNNITTFPNISLAGLNAANAMEYMFYGLNALKKVNIDWGSIPGVVTSLNHSFHNTGLEDLPDALFSTFKSFDYSFYGCKALTLPAGGLNFPVATSLYYMFNTAFSAENNVVIEDINAPLVTDAREMFYASGITGVNGVISMPNASTASGLGQSYGLFGNCDSLITVNATIDAESLNSCFVTCNALETVTLTLGEHVTDINYMFYNCDNLETVAITGNNKNITAGRAFYGCKSLLSLPAIPYENITDMYYMFNTAFSAENNVVIGDINAPLVTDAREMFYASGITGVNGVILMPNASTASGLGQSYGLFGNCDSLITVNATIDAESLNSCFVTCNALETVTLTLGEHVTDINYMFYNCDNLETVAITGNNKNITAGRAFYGCKSLLSLPAIPYENITDMYYMFNTAFSAENNVVIGNINAPLVTDAREMFYASGITGVNGVISMPNASTASGLGQSYGLFGNCDSLITVNATIDAESLNSCFVTCNALETVTLTLGEHVTDINYMFYNCDKLTSLSDLNLENITASYTNIFHNCTSLTTFTDSASAPEGSRWQFKPRSGGVDFSDCPLDRTSILKVFNGLVAAGSESSSYRTIRISSTTRGYLSDEDIAVATDKNWIVS